MTGLEDGPNPHVFPLTIRLARGERFALAPIYLGSLFCKMDECINNIMKFVGRYYVVTYAVTTFLQVFLWGQFETLSQSPHNIQ